MKKQKNRNEIEEKYKWDLSSIYESNEEFYLDSKKAKEYSLELEKFKDIEIDNEDKLLEMINLDFKLSRLLNKLMIYASLKNAEDAGNSKNQELYGYISNLISFALSKTSFVNNKIVDIDDEKMNEILKTKKVKDYKFFLESLLKYKKYNLSDEEEKVLATLSKSLSSQEDTYDVLTNVDMNFGFINVDGEEVEITNSNYVSLLKNKDRNIRKEVFDKFYGTYGKYTKTISSLYSSHLDTNNAITKMRGYKDMLSSDLLSDNLDEEVYKNLIATINNNLDKLHKYYEVRKKILSLDEYHIYDNGVSIIKDIDKEYTYENAQDMIIDALSVMGDDYTSVLKKAFENRWIDVYNNKGKASGAFSSGVYDTNPFILLNFEGKLDDVSALAHELGHSVHTYLSIKNNLYQYFDYSHFIAEVASLTNEIVFNSKLIEKEKDNKVKLYIINNLIKLFTSNLFDACLYAEFELDVHKCVEEDKVLTSDYFNELCLKLNKKYYGDKVEVDENIQYRWEIYSHLYCDFYLYKYSTGISSACYCASKILNNDEKFIKKYKEFLKLGGSMHPSDALLTIGIDVTKKDFIENALNFFDDLVNKLEEVYNKID